MTARLFDDDNDRARTRRLDPYTARAAGDTISGRRRSRVQRAALSTFQLARRPLILEEAVERCERTFPGLATPQGWRSRIAELKRRGAIVVVHGEHGVTKTGRRAALLQLADQETLPGAIAKPCSECGDMSPAVPDDGAHLPVHDCEAGVWIVLQLTLPADDGKGVR